MFFTSLENVFMSFMFTSTLKESMQTRRFLLSPGNTGLDLRFDDDWGIRVQSVDPLPGQPGLAEGDFIVAIDGHLEWRAAGRFCSFWCFLLGRVLAGLGCCFKSWNRRDEVFGLRFGLL